MRKSLNSFFNSPKMPSPTITDLENQFFDGAEFLEVEADEPLLGKAEQAESGNNGANDSSRRSTKSSRYFRRVQETIELDDIPPIIKSANGNIFWADEQCTRRVGLTSTEARLFLRLLQVDEPENFNYDDYKNMFDDFGREEQRLRELVDELPWWSLETYHQRPIVSKTALFVSYSQSQIMAIQFTLRFIFCTTISPNLFP
jgi:hypothetical protein